MLLEIMSNPIAWFIIAGIVLLCIGGILIKSYPILRWIGGTILIVVLIGSAVYSGVQLNTYYNAEGGIYGTIEKFLKQNEASKVSTLKYEINNLSLSPSINEGEYTATIFIDEIINFDENKSYGLYVNGVPCSNIEYSNNHISADFSYAFYDFDNNLMTFDTLIFRVSLYDNYTNLFIKTNGGLSSVKCWHSFVDKEGFAIELKPFDYVEQV